MTYGQILICGGVGLLAFTLILAVVFRVTKKDYRPPEDSGRAASARGAPTEPLASGTPSARKAGKTSLFHRGA